jgi:glyoxylate carboligase
MIGSGLAGIAKSAPFDGHTLVAHSLKSLGVTHAYCLAGTPVRETLAYCARSGIRNIGVRHQQAAVLMATAQNYVSGRMAAVAILSAGPAVTNAVTGVLVAWDNCWPVVVLGGRRPLCMRGMESFQELDAVRKDSGVSRARVPDRGKRASRAGLSRHAGGRANRADSFGRAALDGADGCSRCRT